MPIYEFRCLSCGHIFEILQMSKEQKDFVSCPQCACETLERLLSQTTYSMGSARSGERSTPHVRQQSCPSGSCQTITLPGSTE